MGQAASFSSNRYDIQGTGPGNSAPAPSVYYAYNPTNTWLFGIPGTLTLTSSSATPTPIATFPVATGSATVTCSYRGEILGPQYEVLPLECPMPVSSIMAGTMTLQHVSYFTQPACTDDAGNYYSSYVVTSSDGPASMLFGFFSPKSRPVLYTSIVTITQDVTEAASAPATYTGAKSTKYVSCKTTKSSKSGSSVSATKSSSIGATTSSTTSSSTASSTFSTSTISSPNERDVASASPVQLIRITSTVASGSTYKGPATSTIAKTLHSGYALPDVSYGQSIAQKPTTSTTTTTTTTTTLADARTVSTVTGCSTAPLITPTACATTQFSVSIDSAGDSFNYNVYFSGTGVTEDPTTGTTGNIPENGSGGPIYIQSLPATADTCGVLTNCSTAAATGYGSNSGTDPLYGSLDVHFDNVAQIWYCVGYPSQQTNVGVFSVKNANVGLVYGLSN